MSRVAVVTGGASGIGLAIAQRLAANDRRVAVLDLDGEAAEKAAAGIRDTGVDSTAGQVDVSDRAAVDAAIEHVRTELGPVEIMVTSAGMDQFTKFADITEELWNRVLAVNLTGTFHCLHAAVPDMIEAGWGRIVTISSSSTQSGAPNMAHYIASKGGVVGLTKALAVELGPKGITVNTIPPGAIDTPMSRRAQETGSLPPVEVIEKMIPVRRMGTADDIAAACAFLCSEDAGYITGQQINLNGGRYM
jgi:NAD(P)-dependent dehydrogenase (short-subunit alcohol dehydrogenase family)